MCGGFGINLFAAGSVREFRIMRGKNTLPLLSTPVLRPLTHLSAGRLPSYIQRAMSRSRFQYTRGLPSSTMLHGLFLY